MAIPKIEVPPVALTLRWVVVMARLVGWAWWLIVVLAALDSQPSLGRAVPIGAAVLATIGTALTVVAARNDSFLGDPWFALLDGLIVIAVTGSSWAAMTDALLSGGYPMSWIFIVAYAAGFRWTVAASAFLAAYFAVLHGSLDLGAVRTVGSIQFVVIGLIAGWAFDNLRAREDLRLEAERRLAVQQRDAARQEERANLARSLHDSVLQTLIVIKMYAEDPSQVRYLARRQERDVRRMIDAYRSPYVVSFQGELLRARDEVEDMWRVTIDAVIRDDAELGPPLQAAISAAREAMINAARHSGAAQVHLYSEIVDGRAQINVRDRGAGLASDDNANRQALTDSLSVRVAEVGGTVVVQSATGEGTDITITVPSP